MRRGLLVRGCLLLALACISISISSLSGLAAQRMALVIGNSKYEEWPELKNPSQDAALIAATLGRAGFQSVSKLDASRVGIIEALQNAAEKSRSSTIEAFVFYFAGHGVEVNGENFLIPTDLTSMKGSYISIGAMALRPIFEYVTTNIRASTYVFIIDACREVVSSEAGRSGTHFRGLGRTEAPPGRLHRIFDCARKNRRRRRG